MRRQHSKHSNKYAVTLLAALSFSPSLASADIGVSFYDGAPKDSFTVLNSGACNITNAKLTLDLSQSPAGLIFDTQPTGRGVEVYQPLEIVSGREFLAKAPIIKDGDNQLILELSSLDTGQSIRFTVDLDDTLGGREIVVSGSEMTGAQAILAQGASLVVATFDTNAKAVIQTTDCKP